MKIVLLGYMGSGKTTIGKLLAESINYSFLDLDVLIEKEEQLSIPELFSKKGEIYFRKNERKVLEDVLAAYPNIVLATGGGTPCFGDTIDYLDSLEDVKTVYLKASSEVLTDRLFKEKLKRPLISHLQTKEILNDFIRKHLFERSFYYNRSAFNIQTDKKTIDEIIEEIKDKLNN